MRFISTPSSLRCRRGRGPRFSATRPLNRTLTKLSDRLSAVLFKMNESPRRVGPIQPDWLNCRITRRTAARLGSLWRVASRLSRARCCEMELSSHCPETRQPTRQQAESNSQKERRLREGADGGADSGACGQPLARFKSLRPDRSLSPSRRGSLREARRTGTHKRHRARVPQGTGFP